MTGQGRVEGIQRCWIAGWPLYITVYIVNSDFSKTAIICICIRCGPSNDLVHPMPIFDVFISNVAPLRVTLVGLASSDMSEDASGSRRRR